MRARLENHQAAGGGVEAARRAHPPARGAAAHDGADAGAEPPAAAAALAAPLHHRRHHRHHPVTLADPGPARGRRVAPTAHAKSTLFASLFCSRAHFGAAAKLNIMERIF